MTIDTITVIALVLALINFAAAIFGFTRLYSLDVELNAMKKSTHKIQWMPADPDHYNKGSIEIIDFICHRI